MNTGFMWKKRETELRISTAGGCKGNSPDVSPGDKTHEDGVHELER